MVTTSDQLRERKDASSKAALANAKNKQVVSNIWPCKINGCTKQFAREADLKRHQRTTKLHSLPGYQCPQCDASFTRTDALRRHQKSRHNGVVMEPAEPEPIVDPESPTSNNIEPMPLPTPQTVQGKPTHTGPATGHSSYYRQHTAMTTAYIPQYSHIALPTSATRLNAATNWTQSHPWTTTSDDAPYGYPTPHSASATATATGHYSPSPYYREKATNAPRSASPAPPPNTASDPGGSQPQSPQPSAGSRSGTPQNGSTSSQSGPDTPEADASQNLDDIITDEQIKQLSMHLTPDTLEAMLKTAKLHRHQDNDQVSGGVSLKDINSHADDSRWSSPVETHHSPDFTYSQLDRPEPMDPILTEDGEPMLNPAELLTQESLASPPPS